MAYNSIMNLATGLSEYENSPGHSFQGSRSYNSTTEASADELGEVLNPLEDAGSQRKKRKTRSREITRLDLEPYFEVLPRDIAAKMFGVGSSTFRTRCKELNICEWPYKKRNTGDNQVRICIEALFEDDTCYEMDYQGNQAVEELIQELKNLI